MGRSLGTVLISGPTGGVGKTTVIRALSAYWQRYHTNHTVGAFKLPAMSVFDSSHDPDIADIWQSLSQQQQDNEIVLVEGGGSLGSPVNQDTTIANLAWDWRLPTILVVPVSWEAIACTIATIALARQSRLNLLGVVLNSTTASIADSLDIEIATTLRNITQVNFLGTIPFLEDVDDESALCSVASDLMLEKILGRPVVQPVYAA